MFTDSMFTDTMFTVYRTGKKARADHYVTLVGPDRTLDLEMSSTVERDMMIAGLGKNVDTMKNIEHEQRDADHRHNDRHNEHRYAVNRL